MKTFLSALLAHYQQATTQLCMIWRVQLQSGTVLGFTDFDQDLVIDGVTYQTSQGLQMSTVQSSDGFSVSTIDVTAFMAAGATESDINAGLYDEAVVTAVELRWDSPPTTWDVQNMHILRHGVLGRIDRRNQQLTAEIRSLAARLDTRIGRVAAPTCPWRHAMWNGTTFVAEAVCGADLSGKIHTGTVTAVGTDPRMTFTASGQAEPAGYYNEGLLAMTSGANAGLGQLSVMDVRRYENFVFSLHRPLPYPVEVGDTFTAVRGDNKTLDTCKTVFNNVPNFGGQPHLKGIDELLSNPLLKQLLPPRPDPPGGGDGNPDYDPGTIHDDSVQS